MFINTIGFIVTISLISVRYDQDNKGELLSGIPMSVSPLTWSFIGIVMRPLLNTFQHDTWFIFVKKLSMSPGQILVQ